MAGHDIERDLEHLSAYIDDALTPQERQALEARLARDAALREALEDLRQNARLLATLPRLKAPRNFTLDPAICERRARGFDWWGVRVAWALGAAASLVLVVGVVLMLPLAGGPAPAGVQTTGVAFLAQQETQDAASKAQMAATAAGTATAPVAGERADRAVAQFAVETLTATPIAAMPLTAAPEVVQEYAAADVVEREAATAPPLQTQALMAAVPSPSPPPALAAPSVFVGPEGSGYPPAPAPGAGGGPGLGGEAEAPPETFGPGRALSAQEPAIPPTATPPPTATAAPSPSAPVAPAVALSEESPPPAVARAPAETTPAALAIDLGPALVMIGAALLLVSLALYVAARLSRR